MSIRPKILGYFILPNDDSEGFASLCLGDLIESNSDKLNFPFLNPARLTNCHKGLQRKTINDVELSALSSVNFGWSPTGRFLYQMAESGMSDKLGIPSNRLIITTNRKIMIEIIKFGQPNDKMDLILETKLKTQKYGKILQISHVRPVEYRSTKSRSVRQNTEPFGMKFGLYLTTDDTKNTKQGATLFSIHCLQIDDVCFIYEAEIDAIEYTKEGENCVVTIYEIKTHTDEEDIKNVFNEYSTCSKFQSLSYNQMESSLNKIEDMFVGPKFTFPFRQGELGNVDKFIYGFYDAHNQSALSCISIQEFDCYPGTFLICDATYLLDFVQLLSNLGILSPNYVLTWDKWESWKLTKDENYVTLDRDGESIATLTNWKRV